MASASVLTDLADTLAGLASIPTWAADALGVPAGDRTTEWDRIRTTVCERFAPLNHDSPPTEDETGSLVTVAPQNDPEVKLLVTGESDGSVTAEASFANPVDESWELRYGGPLEGYDEGRDEQIRDRVVYITDAWARAERLSDETVLTPRQADVCALAEHDHTIGRIARILDLTPQATRDSLEHVHERIEAARATVEILDRRPRS